MLVEFYAREVLAQRQGGVPLDGLLTYPEDSEGGVRNVEMTDVASP